MFLGAWRKNCRISDIIQHVRPSLERKAAVKKVRLNFALDDDLPEVYCDAEKAGRVIINLTVNAIKFCGDPGQVCIWAKRDTDSRNVILGVTDNGPGIDEEGLSAIFQRFKQLGGNVRTSTKGFGLGLGIAKELAELNFGEMRVESEVGSGSTFSFSMLVADPSEVMRRYLRRLEQRRSGTSVVSLVSVEIGDSIDSDMADEVDAFLNYLLRRNDLLFRAEQRRWVIALPSGKQELNQFVERAAKARKDTNRNRPHGPLPEIDFCREGTWRVLLQTEKILARIGVLLEPAEVVYD